MSNQEVFVTLYNKYIKREGAAELLAWLENETEFFDAPAGAKHHGAHTGGLVEHSLNVHHRLAKIASVEIFGVSGRIDLLAEDVKESIAVMGLLHDVCKHDVYHADGRGGFDHLREHVKYDGVDHGQDYTGLATYLFDHWTPEQGAKHWRGTKSLVKPDHEKPTPVLRHYSDTKPPKAPKGYVFVEGRTTQYGFLYYKYVREIPKPARGRPHKSDASSDE